MVKGCRSCKRFPCGRSNCNAVVTDSCEHYLEAGETTTNIINNSLSNLWLSTLHDIETKFNTDYGVYKIKTKTDYIELEIHTGGWSENEILINKIESSMFWTFFWYESRRGGHYLFRKPKQKRKYERRK